MHLFKIVFWISADIDPEVELLDHKVVVFFLILRTFHTVFHNDYTNLESHQLSLKVPFPPHPHQQVC